MLLMKCICSLIFMDVSLIFHRFHWCFIDFSWIFIDVSLMFHGFSLFLFHWFSWIFIGISTPHIGHLAVLSGAPPPPRALALGACRRGCGCCANRPRPACESLPASGAPHGSHGRMITLEVGLPGNATSTVNSRDDHLRDSRVVGILGLGPPTRDG